MGKWDELEMNLVTGSDKNICTCERGRGPRDHPIFLIEFL